MKEKQGALGPVASGGAELLAVESMTSRRKMLIEMIDYRRFIGSESVS